MEEIKEWFDSDKWDIGYLTKEQLQICSYSPVKTKAQDEGQTDFTGHMHYEWGKICNGIVLIRHSMVSFDYSLYERAEKILIEHDLKKYVDWELIYTNFKEAEILSGRGVRARNSLVYNYKFGFDSKVCVVGFNKMIQNLPKVKRVAGNNFKEEFWNRCIGCDDCRKNCPVGAIHNNSKEGPNWLNT